MSGELKYDDKIALVIDDQEPVREMVRSMLRSLGFMEIRVASNALDAIELMSKGRAIDLIVCDYSMPYLSGLDFVGAVRTDQANARKDTPIIILTGYAEDDKYRPSSASRFRSTIWRNGSAMQWRTRRARWAISLIPSG